MSSREVPARSLASGTLPAPRPMPTVAPATEAVRTRRGLTGGIVAYNEESTIRSAIGSLLDQRLPDGSDWEALWVVTSGCTDRTEARVREVARSDPRVQLLSQPRREGKSRALDLVFRRAKGRDLILLNADATAEPGAVAELLRAAGGRPRPYAVMGRPVVSVGNDVRTARLMRLQWSLHHEAHAELIGRGIGNHLSDELLLVSLPEVPGIPAGIVNDGSYFGAWLAQFGGELGYAPEARVRVAIPDRLVDHVAQRRRIRTGHHQVEQAFGRTLTTLPAYARRDLPAVLRLVRRTVRDHDGGWLDLATLASAEAGAGLLAAWDRLAGAPVPVQWTRVRTAKPLGSVEEAPPRPPERPSVPPAAVAPEHRVRGLLEVAALFGTGLDLDELLELLPLRPGEPPSSVAELRRWLADRPGLAMVEGNRAYSPAHPVRPDPDRVRRGRSYARGGEELLASSLGFLRRYVSVAGVTGSAAYGEPEAGDDLDFLVITRRGALWWFLALAYLRLRLQPMALPTEDRWQPCFNTVLEAPEAETDFARPRDLLFAREALGVRAIVGKSRYRRLLRSAGWMGTIFPRRYAERTARPEEDLETGPLGRPAPLPVRVANLLVFPWLAAYLQLRGLERNARARREGRNGTFRTLTRLRRMTLSSRRFEQVRRLLDPVLVDQAKEVPFIETPPASPRVLEPDLVAPTPIAAPGDWADGLSPEEMIGGDVPAVAPAFARR